MNAKRILIIDDNPRASKLVATVLERSGLYVAKTEISPYNAVETALDFRPDLILLDVQMPGMDGGDVAFLLGQEQALARIPVVFLTALVTPEQAKAGQVQANGIRYLAKPAPPSILLSCVGSFFNQNLAVA